ncbi:hypothetical protein BJX63DRAFT_126767 [Aspergillus granulosus]|uniref:Retrovirus-related Pol polyprotein from transposon TNT 1-94-like beta-barrel domain-containing protein n=1 Tax=Aspergillus granulosus TaxID=176169 RepID=A0ABR4I4A5_9EURO
MTSIKSHHNPYHTRHEKDHPGFPSFAPAPKPPTKTSRCRKTKPTLNPRSTSNPSSNRCWTWLLIPTGNMHWAKNRSSFSTYRRAPLRIGGTRVLGIGTVELKVRRGPAPDDDRMNTLVLRDVLHVPQARCNGLCLGRYRQTNTVEVDSRRCVDGSGSGNGEEVRVFSEGEGSGSEGEEIGHRHRLNHKHGEALWYGEGYHGYSRVVLWGDPHGTSDLDNVEGDVDIRGVDASAEELDTLYMRVKERRLV